ncbi:MAG: ribonuclease D [Rickettsiales bacterium]|jgi:ribonuclease D|nr:ribonuclease D [Rickettsiales bacterium]
MSKKIIYSKGDLPSGVRFGKAVGIDTETDGLSLEKCRLCLVQMTDGGGTVHIVKVDPPYRCPNLKKVLLNPRLLKIFHFARFDVAMIRKYLGVRMENIFCTKIASRIARPALQKHSLKNLVEEFFKVRLNKDEQTSDWTAAELTKKQIEYAANDVVYLHRIKDMLERRLKEERKLRLAKECFGFLPARAELDIDGWQDVDIFAH